MSLPPVVIGVGNRYRRDDGSAIRVLDVLAGRVPTGTVLIESDGEPARLVETWSGASLAIVVETVLQGTAPGTVSDIGWHDLVARTGNREHGSHDAGIAEAIGLGRALDRMPETLLIVGIEPEDLGWGEGLSDAVSGSIDSAANVVLALLK